MQCSEARECRKRNHYQNIDSVLTDRLIRYLHEPVKA
jgi:hypothetical protein